MLAQGAVKPGTIIAKDQSITLPASAPAAQTKPEAEQSADFSHRWGTAAFKHKEFFEGSAGSLMFRNFVRSAFAIFPYAVVNVAVQNFFNRTMNRVNAPGLGRFTEIFDGKSGANIMQTIVAIALSFTTFRTISKIWNRNYDRIFGAKTEEDSIKAVHDLGHNIIKDAKDITPLEFSVTGAAAITLAAIRNGIKVTHPPGGPVSYMRDLAANVLGYSVFFDITDRLFKTFGDSRKKRNAAPEIVQPDAKPIIDNSVVALQADRIHKADEAPAATPHSQKFARFTGDTLTRALFRNATSVLVGAVPYIATQRKGYDLVGWHKAINSYPKDLGICLAGFVIPFAIFTTGIELYQRAYDKLFEKLDQKYAPKAHAMA